MTIFLTNEALAERLMALERLVDQRFEASDMALDRAREAMENRLNGMNEFLAALTDQANRTLPRLEYDAQHSKIVEDIKILMKSKSELEGKASQQALMLVLAVALTGMVFGVIGLVMRFLKI